MEEFLENIIHYLQSVFNADTDFSEKKKPLVYDAYKVNHEPTASKPEIQVQITDAREQTNYTTFCGKRAMSVPVQFTAYSGQIGKETNAQYSSIKIADKIVKYIDELVYGGNEYGISMATHISSTLGLPMNDGGTIYASVVRYNFVVQ